MKKVQKSLKKKRHPSPAGWRRKKQKSSAGVQGGGCCMEQPLVSPKMEECKAQSDSSLEHILTNTLKK
jgi:hypothetical protein